MHWHAAGKAVSIKALLSGLGEYCTRIFSTSNATARDPSDEKKKIQMLICYKLLSRSKLTYYGVTLTSKDV